MATAFQGLDLVLASFQAISGLTMFFGMAGNGAIGQIIHATKEAHKWPLR